MTSPPHLPSLPADQVELVEKVAVKLRGRVDDYARELIVVIRESMDALQHDVELERWLFASIAENTTQIVENLRDRVDPRSFGAPPGARGYAVQLARSDVPMAALLRAYRFGQARFTQWCLRALDETAQDYRPETVQYIVDQIAIFIDHICEIVAVDYETERDRWIGSQGGLRQHWVNALLDVRTSPRDLEIAQEGLEYPLEKRHLALELWIPRPAQASTSAADLAHAVSLTAKALGAQRAPLVVPVGSSEVRVWLPVAGEHEIDPASVRDAIEPLRSGIKVALGYALPGLDGFRRTFVQASRAKAVAERRFAASERVEVVHWREVCVVSLLLDHPLDVKDLIDRNLGELAQSGERTRGLRETLLTFLECHRSYGDTAERLFLHRNTVRYRVDQAEQLLARPPEEDPSGMLLALQLLQWTEPQPNP